MPAPTLLIAPMRADDLQKKKDEEKAVKTDSEASTGKGTETKDGDAEGEDEDLVRSPVDACLHSGSQPLD